MKQKRGVLLFLGILAIAIFLRAYKLPTLTTFGGDQGQDFMTVYDMIVNHKWTLLGIKTSAFSFYQGPVYLYMLLPFFYLFKLAPIAGAIASVFYSAVTLVFLYITVRKYFSEKLALVSSAIFATAPELVKYGNTPLYQHFLPVFIIPAIYLFLVPKKNFRTYFLLGLILGLGIETHLLNVILAAGIFVYIILYELKSWKKSGWIIPGILTGLLPTIVFELRHNFLNTRYLFSYHPTETFTTPAIDIAKNWARGAGMFLGADSYLLGAIILLFVLVFLLTKNIKHAGFEKLSKLVLIIIPLALIFSFKFSAFGSYYILPLWLILIILLPYIAEQTFSKRVSAVLFLPLITANLVTSISAMNINHGYSMPDGWSLKKMQATAGLIYEDVHERGNFNIASQLDADTRAYALRYILTVKKMKPEGVINYPMNNYLYVVSRNIEDVKNSGIYEIEAFRPFTIEENWNLGEGIILYRLRRNSWTERKRE